MASSVSPEPYIPEETERKNMKDDPKTIFEKSRAIRMQDLVAKFCTLFCGIEGVEEADRGGGQIAPVRG